MSAVDCSLYLLSFFDSKGDTVTNRKLQKLLYFINAWHLAYFDEPLIKEEPEAWPFGPVFTSSHNEYKQFEFNNISISDLYKDYDDDPEKFIQSLIKKTKLEPIQVELIRAVLLKYGSFVALDLELISNNDPPWLNARKGLKEFENRSIPITHESVLETYKQLLPKNN